MKKAFIMIALVVGLCLTAGPVFAGQFKIDGSTTVLPISQKLAEAFMKENPGVNIAISGSGSGNGIKAMIDKTTEVAQSSRWIKDSEVKMAVDNGVYPVPFAVAHDGIIPVVHPSNPVNNITMEQLRGIYNGKITNWKELGGADATIVSTSRDSSSGTYGVWVDMVLKGDRISPRSQLLPSNGAIVQNVSGNPNAIGYIGIGYLNENLKSITVDGVKPSWETVRSGDYPIARTLWLLTDNWPTGDVMKFIQFALDPKKGQPLVGETGYIPLY